MARCVHCGRPAWKSHGGMGGGIMPDHQENCIKAGGMDCRTAYEGRRAGLSEGREQGRREMLWLMAIGAECRYAHRCETISRICLGETLTMRNAALRALADLGDEQAAKLLGGG